MLLGVCFWMRFNEKVKSLGHNESCNWICSKWAVPVCRCEKWPHLEGAQLYKSLK